MSEVLDQSSYKVELDIFEGPLDLLLHLIKKEEVDIYDIPIARILDQYMDYLNFMELLDINIAGDFLVMAATLMYIKSKMLLPPDPNEEDEEDPRDSLVDQLLEYQKFKQASEFLEQCEETQKERFYRGRNDQDLLGDKEVVYQVGVFQLMDAFRRILNETPEKVVQEIVQEEITVEERLADVVECFKRARRVNFRSLFQGACSKLFVVATFLAVLEMIRLKEVIVVQEEPFGEIYLDKVSEESHGEK